MKNAKIAIDTYFNDNWVGSTLSFDGQHFDLTDKHIVVKVIPIDRNIIGFGGTQTRKQNTLQLQVTSFGTNPLKALELDDAVRDFIECTNLGSIRVDVGVPNGEGVIPLDNDIYSVQSHYEIKDI